MTRPEESSRAPPESPGPASEEKAMRPSRRVESPQGETAKMEALRSVRVPLKWAVVPRPASLP